MQLVTSMWNDNDDYRALLHEDDRRRAERAEPIRPPVMSGNGDAGVLTRDGGSRVLQEAPMPEPEVFYAEDGFSQAQTDALATIVNSLRDEWQRDHAEQMAELRGQVKALLTILGNRGHDPVLSKSADVIGLPQFIKRRSDAA
jgi:hypothetical protein